MSQLYSFSICLVAVPSWLTHIYTNRHLLTAGFRTHKNVYTAFIESSIIAK